MPRSTALNVDRQPVRGHASMRPRRNAAEYESEDESLSTPLSASMRPRRNAAEYAVLKDDGVEVVHALQ